MPVDNIPGVPGIGRKTASMLFRHFESLAHLYDNLDSVLKLKLRNAGFVCGQLRDYRDSAFLARRLTGIACDMPLEVALTDLDGVHRIWRRSTASTIRWASAGCCVTRRSASSRSDDGLVIRPADGIRPEICCAAGRLTVLRGMRRFNFCVNVEKFAATAEVHEGHDRLGPDVMDRMLRGIAMAATAALFAQSAAGRWFHPHHLSLRNGVRHHLCRSALRAHQRAYQPDLAGVSVIDTVARRVRRDGSLSQPLDPSANPVRTVEGGIVCAAGPGCARRSWPPCEPAYTAKQGERPPANASGLSPAQGRKC